MWASSPTPHIYLNGFLVTLNGLIRLGFRLKEEVYIEAVKEARRISEA